MRGVVVLFTNLIEGNFQAPAVKRLNDLCGQSCLHMSATSLKDIDAKLFDIDTMKWINDSSDR